MLHLLELRMIIPILLSIYLLVPSFLIYNLFFKPFTNSSLALLLILILLSPSYFILIISLALSLFKRLTLLLFPADSFIQREYTSRSMLPRNLRIHNALNGFLVATFIVLFYTFPFVAFPGFLKPFFYRLAGAKIGKGTRIYGILSDPDLIEIGDNTIVGTEAAITGHEEVPGRLYINTVLIGNNVIIGARSIVLPGAKIGDNSVVGAFSCVPKNRVVPSGYKFLSLTNRVIK